MKTKKVTKKLSLIKKTVSNLNVDELKMLYGGNETIEYTICATWCVSNCLCYTKRVCYTEP